MTREEYYRPEIINVLNNILYYNKPYILLEKWQEIEKQKLESVGFTFYNIPSNEYLWLARLPKGWSISDELTKSKVKKLDYYNIFTIRDEKGRERGELRLLNAGIQLWMFQRYTVRCAITPIDEMWQEVVVFLGNDEERLFVAGTILQPTNDAKDEFEELNEKYFETQRVIFSLYNVAREYAKENYPDYKDDYAYWDDEQIVK